MFGKSSKEGYTEILPGIRIKTLCYGVSTLMSEFLLQEGALLPAHEHPYEQTGYLVKGHIRLTVDAVIMDIFPGDSWCIPMNVNHRAEIIKDSVAIEIFSPLREDYLRFLL